MNPNNYASLEASKRLHDAGIVLETEAYWIRVANSPMMLVDNRHGADEHYPAPSMAEVWRELPGMITADRFIYYVCLNQIDGKTYACYRRDEIEMPHGDFNSENPTDALIDLLIWVRKEKE